MAIWAQTDFEGGAIGTAASNTTEPIFSLSNGALTYQAGTRGPGQSVESTTSGSGDFTLDLTGHDEIRLALDVQRVSGTQTAGMLFFLFRNGTASTGQVDAFLRNAGGGQWALRNNFAYEGQSSTAHANGQTWHMEMHWKKSESATLYLWHDGNETSVPDETFTCAFSVPHDRVRIGNSTGNTGVSVRFSAFRATEGEAFWVGEEEPEPGVLNWNHNGYADSSSFAVKAKTTGAATVALAFSTEPDHSNQLTTDPVEPDVDGYATLVADGLSPDTKYYWNVIVDGVRNTSMQGETNTLKPAGGQRDIRFGWGSCFDSNGSSVFGLIAARGIDFYSMLGDFGYQYITGGANGNTSPTDIETVRSHRTAVLSNAGPRTLFATTPFHYTYSDCDGAGANADGTTGGHATGAVQAAYRQQFAHPSLPLAASGARSWVIGRVRFIQTDETANATSKAATDNSSKTKLGAEQKAWFKGQIDAAVTAGQIVIWLGDGPWITPNPDANSWSTYNTERTEIGNYIASSGVRLIRLHGDTHTLFCDDGTNNSWGGFPCASAAPMHTTAQPYGTTVSGGKWPTATTNSSRQYGICDITDNGDTISVQLRGYSSTVSAPTEVERFNQTTVFNMVEHTQPWIRIMIGSRAATAAYVGAQRVWTSTP